MPVKVDLIPPPPANSKQPGITKSLLYNGSKFQGHQKSKGNSYEVEVVLQVRYDKILISLSNINHTNNIQQSLFSGNTSDLLLLTAVNRISDKCCFQHVDEENSYLCGYLQINGLTDEFPKLTTFFDGEIISKKYPFLTRKWDADEDVDKKHWVCYIFNY